MNLFKNKNGDIYAYSDEDLINLATGKLIKADDFTHEELLDIGHDIIINDYGYIPFSYSDDELSEQAKAKEIELHIAQAKLLLSQNDYRQIKALLGLYTEDKRTAVLDYMEELRVVIRNAKQGIIIELPEQPLFMKE